MAVVKNLVLILYLELLILLIFGQKVEKSNDSCLNDTFCDNTTILENSDDKDFDDVNIKNLATGIFKFPGSTKTTTSTTSTTTESSVSRKEKDVKANKEIDKLQKVLGERSKEKYCNCDLTIGVCDVNCCCDLDCTEKHLGVFSYCVDREIDKDKDMWYCHEKPFFRHNETRFILEKIVDSLFCIASDNLPPMYSLTSHLQIDDEKSLKKVINNNKPSQFKWKLETRKILSQEFNISNAFRYRDILWEINKNSLQPFELPQTGFGKACDFKKTVKFLEDWKTSCHQNHLDNKNPFLFPIHYSNFSIIALPSKFKTQYLVQDCPKTVCCSINVYFCSESWINCKTNITARGYCTESLCLNVAKRVKYIIYHNGNEGIKNIEVQIQLANVSSSFKQEFEVQYKWFGINDTLIFERSGNPGYIEGKPIFIGTQMLNKTEEMEVKYIMYNRSYPYLTLPISEKNGMCSENKRYKVKFLENIKLKCSITVKSTNFSTSACIKLQNRTFETFINFMMLQNFEKFSLNRQYVSKSGNVSDNNTESWAKIFFEKIPQNVITAQIMENEIQCSGLVTSVVLDIVHSSISKPGTKNNHVIIGVGVTFSQEVDLKWPKCNEKNCKETLQLDLVSFVSFHDVSKPTRYYIAGGPNLDISLPYDFFYPFLSHSKSSAPLSYNGVIYNCITLICIIFIHL